MARVAHTAVLPCNDADLATAGRARKCVDALRAADRAAGERISVVDLQRIQDELLWPAPALLGSRCAGIDRAFPLDPRGFLARPHGSDRAASGGGCAARGGATGRRRAPDVLLTRLLNEPDAPLVGTQSSGEAGRRMSAQTGAAGAEA